MTIYIARDGQRLGPYTLADTQSLVDGGTLQARDWAWYQGRSDWIPLNEVPGFAHAVTGAPPATKMPVPPAKRPVLVWIISLLYFLYLPFALYSLVMLRFIASAHVLASYEYFYVIRIAIIAMDVCWAVMLFQLKRQALYFGLGSAGVGLTALIYNIVAKNLLSIASGYVLFSIAFFWALNFAVLYYTWRLFKKGVLR